MSHATDLPPAPKHSGLKAGVIVMAVLLVVGFIVVFATIAYRVMSPREPLQNPARSGFGTLVLPVAGNQTIRSFELVEDRLAIHIGEGSREEIVIVDVRKGVELGRVVVTPAR